LQPVRSRALVRLLGRVLVSMRAPQCSALHARVREPLLAQASESMRVLRYSALQPARSRALVRALVWVLGSMRAMVDVLTLTATPIPRTLNLALLGLRDISNLTTPPEGRMPVQTEVAPFDEKRILAYLLRELRRGGQVFVVHNRIETIHRIDRLVGALVPSARRAVVHGRMPRRELARSMLSFVRGDIDVLVATTII
jgi:hypothetical protein